MKIYGYSKALYSTWLYLEPLRLMFDAGEGLNTFLEGRLLAFRDIAITHAHTDHFTGLQNVLITRLREMEVTGEDLPPLHVYYPFNSGTLQRYFSYLEDVTQHWEKLIQLNPMRPGDTLPLQGARGLYLTAIKAEHRVHRQVALAYRITQERWALKEELRDIPQKEINRLIAEKGREAATERTLRPLIYYSGDGKPLFDEESKGASLMIQEATFLEPHARIDHSSLPEAIDLFRQVKADSLLLFHLSTRYEFRHFLQLLDKLVPDPDERARIFAIKPGNMLVRDIHIPGF